MAAVLNHGPPHEPFFPDQKKESATDVAGRAFFIEGL
jgi:hypothetical protein